MSINIFKMQLPSFLLGSAVSLYVFADIIKTLLVVKGRISDKILMQLSATSLTALALQLLIAIACARYCGNKTYASLIAAIFFALNLIFFHLMLIPDFVLSHIIIKFLIFAGVATSFFVVLWKGHPVVVTWLTIIVFASSMLTAAKINDIFHPEQAPLPDSDYYIPIPVPLQHKPNIYLLSFDGLMGQDMFNLHFSTSNTEPIYITNLKALGAEIIDNSIADGNTLTTFNRMLAVDHGWWDNLPTATHKRRLLSGRQNSPIYDVLKSSGYTISLIYKNEYLSRGEKTNIDFYYHQQVSICGKNMSAFAFWFHCPIFGDARAAKNEVLDFMDNKLQQLVVSSQAHKFVLSYWRVPHHVSSYYDWHDKDQVKAFKRKYLADIQIAADIMKRNVNFIRSHDPDAIILVFGDHGAHITRGTIPEEGIFTAEQRRRDIYGITLATINHGSCQLQNDNGETYIGNVLTQLMVCLSEGK